VGAAGGVLRRRGDARLNDGVLEIARTALARHTRPSGERRCDEVVRWFADRLQRLYTHDHAPQASESLTPRTDYIMPTGHKCSPI